MSELEPLNVNTAVSRLAALYEQAGPRLGCMLVEANIVLTVAGARGESDLFIDDPIPDDLETLEHMQPALDAAGLRYYFGPETHTSPVKGRPFWAGSLSSLAGYARVSQLSHLPGVTRFEATSGWQGWETWARPIFQAIQDAYPVHFLTAWEGLTLGYPDQAVLDFCAALDAGTVGQLEMASLPACWRYPGAQPLFDYAPEHADDPGILATCIAWNTLLEGVYASVWHQHLATDPAFLAAREERR